ncbi:YfjI family protein [Roseateles sp. BYS96W]|uniref:YfjI family protein n=1 Tax=Pelomonas nitida TaxID=3299027 RepID=A0ABW7G9Z5_9BURK
MTDWSKERAEHLAPVPAPTNANAPIVGTVPLAGQAEQQPAALVPPGAPQGPASYPGQGGAANMAPAPAQAAAPQFWQPAPPPKAQPWDLPGAQQRELADKMAKEANPGSHWLDIAEKADSIQTHLQPVVSLRRTLHQKEFPLERLPPLLAAAVREAEGITQAPWSLIATCAITAVAAAVQLLTDVSRDDSLRGPTSLFAMTVAESGERKTTVDKLFTAAIHEWEAEAAAAAERNIKAARAMREAWDAQLVGIKEAIRKAARDGDDARQRELTTRMTDHMNAEPRMISAPSLLRQDDTPESLLMALSRYPGGYAAVSEGALLLGAHGMNPESVMRNLGQQNGLWDGQRIKRERVSSFSADVEGARLTVGLQLQSAVLTEFHKKNGELADGMGYFARFLINIPSSTQGMRLYRLSNHGRQALTAFKERLKHLLRCHRLDPDGKLLLHELRLNAVPETKGIWIDYHDSIEEELGPRFKYSDVRGAASKSADNAARLAACFAMFDEWPTDGNVVITPDHMRAGADVARWYLDEALRFQKTMAVPEAILNAEALEWWLAEQCFAREGRTYPAASVLRLGPNKLRTKAARDAALDVLIAHGRIYQECDKKDRSLNTLVLPAAVLREYQDTFEVTTQ